MIKNSASALAVAAICACGAETSVPSGYQGVVEHDDRVLGFEVSGRIRQVAVRRGDIFTEGTVLAEVDRRMAVLTREARSDDVQVARSGLALLAAGTRREDLAAAQADARGARATEQLLEREEERSRQLAQSGSLSPAQLDVAREAREKATYTRKATEQRLASLRRGARSEEIEEAKARLEQASKALALEDERLNLYTLHAPLAGEVLDVHLREGELASAFAPVITIADSQHPYTDVFVPEGELGTVRAGSKAHVKVDAHPAPFAGTVEHVSQQAEFTPHFLFSPRDRPSLVLRVRVRIDDPQRELHAGVPAFVEVVP